MRGASCSRIVGATVFGLLAVNFVTLLGCSPAKSSVTGRVTYKGKTMTSGSVIMVGPDGAAGTSIIDGIGTYRIEGLTPGKIQVAVCNPSQAEVSRGARPGLTRTGDAKGTKPAENPDWIAIPNYYTDPSTSNVTVSLKSGANKFDIELQ
jgi:hypothetical protein